MQTKMFVAILALALSFAAYNQKASSSPDTKAVAFEHAVVIDATGSPAMPNMTVVIRGNRISEIGSAKAVHVPKDAKVIDATNQFLVPGLWDMHAHVLTDKAEILLPLLVANGITGARDMGNDNDVPIEVMDAIRKKVAQGTLIGPRVVMAGHLLDGPKPVIPSNVALTTEAQARRTVINLKMSGVDFIKVYTALPRNLYFAIADEAKKQDLPFVGHVPISVTAEEASDAGQKSFEHMTGVIGACSRREADLRPALQEKYEAFHGPTSEIVRFAFVLYQQQLLDAYDSEKAVAAFDHLRKNGIWQCPTLVALRTVAFFDDRNFLKDPRLKYIPRSWTFWTDPDRRHTDQFLKDLTDEDYANEKRAFQMRLEIVSAMNRAGIKFLAGTDTPLPSVHPGFSLHEELALFVKAGMTPIEALQTATLNPAKFLNIEQDSGTIQKGKIADLVLLDANPLDNINNTQRINAVVVNGRLLDRNALDNLLMQVEAAAKKN
jgi:Amidohydrolase family